MKCFKILGMADEGKCECCGANCPKRRVAVRPVDADGCEHDVQFWGVICASKVRTGSKAVRFQNQIVAEAQRADADREYFTRQKMARIITALPHIHNLGFGNARISNNAKDAANQMYRMTGRNIMGSYFAENAAGHIVRVDGTDAKDVQFYADLGFTQTTAAVAA
jgi:hypothetical protein